VTEGLRLLSLSPEQLAVAFVILLVILILLFLFIFCGIQGFSYSSSFTSIVNGALPVGAGATVNQKSPANFKDPDFSKKLKDVADEVIQMIGG